MRKMIVVASVPLLACSDFALEAMRVPATLELEPRCAQVGSENPVQLQIRVRDQEGALMPVPGWVPISVQVSDPSIASVGDDLMLQVKGDGRVVVTASMGEMDGDATFHVSADPLQLSAPLIYLTQGAQNAENSTRLIAGRDALLRVFMTADRADSVGSGIRITLQREDEPVLDTIIATERAGIPLEVDESTLEGSYNFVIPGEHIQPGTSMAIELDPMCEVPVAAGSRTRYPESGATLLNVVAPQTFRQVFVPTLMINDPDYEVFTWLEGIGPNSEQMHLTRNLLPVSADLEVEVHDTLWTTANLRTWNGWLTWLGEIQALNLQEGRRGYYYGVIGRPLGSLLGLANIAVPWSVGVATADTYTHEIGHNMNLRHAPCGGAGGPDPDYPHIGGRIGVWGYDNDNRVLKDPAQYLDVMSYCDPVWISDYHFDRATTHRLDGDGGVALNGFVERREVLVVWGSVYEGRLQLDPAILLRGPVEMPSAPGPYTVEGLGPNGERKFAFSFAPLPTDHGGSTFVFFVPYDPEWDEGLERVTLAGPEGMDEVFRGSAPPIAVATHPETGVIKAIVRDWDGTELPIMDDMDVSVSTGLPGPGSVR
ncbi:MAG: hypothetical protein J4F34_00245 [Gemmatimonadetes bacterium]|nr:hypothetical protein [Gemmatimonadota bacterium]